MDIEQVIRGLEPTTWGYTHMTRDRWAAQQHAIFDYGQVTSTVSTDPRDYASGTEIDAMLQALNVHRDQLGLSRPIDLDRKELRRRCFQAAKRLRDGEERRRKLERDGPIAIVTVGR